MSLMYFIASNRTLPAGSSGEKRIKAAESPKVIRFLSEEVPAGSIPLDQIIDLSEISEDEIEIYDSFEDAAGIFVTEIHPSEKDVKRHFRNVNIYSLSPNWGKFFITEELKNNNPQVYKENRKCLAELFDYISRNLSDDDEIELYVCWAGEEGEERKEELDTEIFMCEFELGDRFQLKERQYIKIRKSINSTGTV